MQRVARKAVLGTEQGTPYNALVEGREMDGLPRGDYSLEHYAMEHDVAVAHDVTEVDEPEVLRAFSDASDDSSGSHSGDALPRSGELYPVRFGTHELSTPKAFRTVHHDACTTTVQWMQWIVRVNTVWIVCLAILSAYMLTSAYTPLDGGYTRLADWGAVNVAMANTTRAVPLAVPLWEQMQCWWHGCRADHLLSDDIVFGQCLPLSPRGGMVAFLFTRPLYITSIELQHHPMDARVIESFHVYGIADTTSRATNWTHIRHVQSHHAPLRHYYLTPNTWHGIAFQGWSTSTSMCLYKLLIYGQG
jgi:hypothetical protein